MESKKATSVLSDIMQKLSSIGKPEEVKEVSRETIEKIVEAQIKTEARTNKETRQRIQGIKGEIERLVDTKLREQVNKVYQEEGFAINDDNYELELLLILSVI